MGYSSPLSAPNNLSKPLQLKVLMLPRFVRHAAAVGVAVLFSLPSSGSAADTNGNFANMSMISCRDFTSAYAEEQRLRAEKGPPGEHEMRSGRFNQVSYYVFGVATALNAISPNTYSVVTNDQWKLLKEINDLCAQPHVNPAEPVVNAVLTLAQNTDSAH